MTLAILISMGRDPSALLKKQSYSCPKNIDSSFLSLNLRFNLMHLAPSGFRVLSPFQITSLYLLNGIGSAAGVKNSFLIEYLKYSK